MSGQCSLLLELGRSYKEPAQHRGIVHMGGLDNLGTHARRAAVSILFDFERSLELCRLGLRAAHDILWDTSQAGHVNAVALVAVGWSIVGETQKWGGVMYGKVDWRLKGAGKEKKKGTRTTRQV